MRGAKPPFGHAPPGLVVVFNTSLDPLAVGLVASFNRPGGNVTGITSLNTEVASKRLELLHEVVPKATTIGLLVNQANPQLAHVIIADTQAASRSLALQILVLNASSNDEIDETFAALARQGIGALVVTPDPLFNSRSEQLAALVLRYALPTISAHREFTMAGGLFSYGTSLVDIYRQLGVYAAKILKGENPAELPVSQSTKIGDYLFVSGRLLLKRKRIAVNPCPCNHAARRACARWTCHQQSQIRADRP
jgi:putative tryptophan/tyrosine transport system substrate-binding protein